MFEFLIQEVFIFHNHISRAQNKDVTPFWKLRLCCSEPSIWSNSFIRMLTMRNSIPEKKKKKTFSFPNARKVFLDDTSIIAYIKVPKSQVTNKSSGHLKYALYWNTPLKPLFKNRLKTAKRYINSVVNGLWLAMQISAGYPRQTICHSANIVCNMTYVCSPIKRIHISSSTYSLFGEVGITQGMLECHLNLSLFNIYIRRTSLLGLLHSWIFKWIKLYCYWVPCTRDINNSYKKV